MTQPDSASHTCFGKTLSTPKSSFLRISVVIVTFHKIVREHFSTGLSDRRLHWPPATEHQRLCVCLVELVCPLSKNICQIPAHSKSRQTHLYSNLCSVPVIAMVIIRPTLWSNGSSARAPRGQSLQVLQTFKRPFCMRVLHLLASSNCGI